MGLFLPLLLLAGGGGIAYAASKKKSAAAPAGTSAAPVTPAVQAQAAQQLRGVAPAGATAPPTPQVVIPPGTPTMQNPTTGAILNPASAAANAIANLLQPAPTQQNGAPATQPPLPVVPPQSSLPIGQPATVATTGTGNDGALRVRATASTTGTVIPGGEPANGGGFDHGQTVQITGPLIAGFSPVTGQGRQGGTLTGYAWGGYLKGAGIAEQAAAQAGSAVNGEMYQGPSEFSVDFGADRKGGTSRIAGRG